MEPVDVVRNLNHAASGKTPLQVRNLLAARAYPHAVSNLELIETRIAWVVLTGRYAYKIKKPVQIDGLDYSTLERRRAACVEELQRNRHFAPEVYLDVVPISGPADSPTVDGTGPAIEYALRMNEFPQNSQLDRLLESGRFEGEDIDALATVIADFHCRAPRAFSDCPYGFCEHLERSSGANLKWLVAHTRGRTRDHVKSLGSWIRSQTSLNADVIAARRHSGFVRELHGDLRLANLAKLSSGIRPFDSTEAGAELRWIDVMSDLAHLTMDFHVRGRSDLAYAVLNRYLELTGDYEGVALLRIFEIQRALEWARAAFPHAHPGLRSLDEPQEQALLHLMRIALKRTELHRPAMILMHGVSGSGKTWLSERIMAALPAIRIRADVERSRLHAMRHGVVTGDATTEALLSTRESDVTYDHLARAACSVLKSGECAILDATLLTRSDRGRFIELSRHLEVDCIIVSCAPPTAAIRHQLALRAPPAGRPAKGAATRIRKQMAASEPLDGNERDAALTVDTRDPRQVQEVIATLRSRLQAENAKSRPADAARHGGVPHRGNRPTIAMNGTAARRPSQAARTAPTGAR